MKVLLVSGSFPPMKCGVGDYSRSLAEALASLPAVEVAVLTGNAARPPAASDGFRVFPVMRRWGLSEALKVFKVIWQWSPDVIHIQYPTQGYANGALPWLLPLIALAMGKKVVQTWHEGYAGRDLPKLLGKLIVPGPVVVVRSQYLEKLHPVLRRIVSKKRLVFIRNASSIPRVELSDQEKIDKRRQYLKHQKRLIVFFGFVYAFKGVDILFEVADPATDQIVIAGAIDENDDFSKKILRMVATAPWSGKVVITGFLPALEIASLLAVADAVILPFKTGAGEWNTSIHAAVLNGTFVLTTSLNGNGYNHELNVYYANVDNIQEMRDALEKYIGRRREYNPGIDIHEWKQIAFEHFSLYQ